MSLNLYSSMIVLCPECIGSLVCEVFLLCILNNVCCLLYLCPFFSFQAFVYRLKFLFSVSSLSLHQVLGCYCIPLNICKICSVPLSASVSLVSVFCQFFVTSSGPWLLLYPTKYL